MIAAAVNYLGISENEDFAAIFARHFDDFKVIRLNPADETKPGQLQLCQPENYTELLQQVQITGDISETSMEISGPRDKLQRTIRQMLFFEDVKPEKVLLIGSQGILDFPWAVQIVLMQMPVKGGRQYLKWVRKADVLFIDDSKGAVNDEFINKVRTMRPELLIFTGRIQEFWPGEMQDSLKKVFAAYLDKRQGIKQVLAEKYPAGSLSCEQGRYMAGKLKVSRFLFGNVCDECGYMITQCGLGCF